MMNVDAQDRDEPLGDKVKGFAEQARSATARAAGQLSEGAKAAVDVARTKVDESYRAVTFAEHRQSVEQTLNEIVDVLVALDARVSALEQAIDRTVPR